MKSPRKGLSDMDVARATMGQGWPFVACPWSGDGAREPRRSRGRMVGGPSLWLLSLGQARESDSPVRGETKTKDRHANDRGPEINSAAYRTHKIASPASSVSSPSECEEPFSLSSKCQARMAPPTRRTPSVGMHRTHCLWQSGLNSRTNPAPQSRSRTISAHNQIHPSHFPISTLQSHN